MARVVRVLEIVTNGALAPMLIAEGILAIYTGLDLFGINVTFAGKTLALVLAIAGIPPAFAGIVLVARPHSPYWFAIVAIAFPVAAQVAYAIGVVRASVSSRIEDTALWVALGLLTSVYAIHCHMPLYRIRWPFPERRT